MTIWKLLPAVRNGVESLRTPRGARVLSVGSSPQGNVAIWALVDAAAELEPRRFAVLGTGVSILPDVAEEWHFLGTVNEGPFIWHVFEEPTT